MSRRLAVVCLLSVAVTIFGGESPVPDMPMEFRAVLHDVATAAAAATTSRFPDADSVIVDDRFHTRYETDGTGIIWEDEWIKVLTEKGRRAYRTVELEFNDRYENSGISLLEVVGTNGVARRVDFSKTLKVATDNSSMDANIVDPHDRKASCAVPELGLGEIRHVRTWRRIWKPRMKGTWADQNLLEMTMPILSTVVTVDQPADLPLAHAVVRNAYSNTVVRAADVPLEDGRKLLKWTARDVPQLFREPNMPSLLQCAQVLRVSTVPDWPTVSRWYWGLCEPHLAKTTVSMTNQVATMVKGCRSEEERIRALFKFVSQEVRYMGLTLEDDAPGYEPHDVDVTFDNRYGVCRDKAALLVALLRIAGVRAFPVLIHAGSKRDSGVPSPFFNHAIVAVETASEHARSRYMLMDPTDESTKDLFPAYLSDKSYLVARPEGEGLWTSPVPSAEVNMLHVETEGSLDGNGDALLSTTFHFDGINDTVVRHGILKKTPEERRRWGEGLWRGIAAGAELLSIEIRPDDLRDTDCRLTMKTVVRLPEAVLRGDTQDSLKLPFITRVLSIASGILNDNTALEKRRFPLVLPCTAGTDETLRLSLNGALGRVLSVPKTEQIQAGAYVYDRKVDCTNGVLTARRTVRVADVDFDVPAYGRLRDARKEVETAERVEPLFAARADDGANVRNHLHSRTIHYLSPTAWVVTNIVEKDVLTYRGKQDTSELKFSYAPCTRGVELVSATVSNRNGKVFSITPREINFMDCGWAASAPRYPASKILVANLPAVEIGSRVRYVVAHTVTNAPVADAFTYVFGGADPYVLERVEMHVPHGLPFRHESFRLPGDALTIEQNDRERVYTWTMRNPARRPEESSQPPEALWRAGFRVSLADWEGHGKALVGALAAARGEGSAWCPWSGDSTCTANARRRAREVTAGCASPSERIVAIRRALQANAVRGPGVFELPFDRAFTAPDQVLAEGYGSRADHMNLLYTMLEAVGFRCSFVLVANDSRGFRGTEAQWRAVPRPGIFGTLVLRAVWNGGWMRMPWCGAAQEFWISRENEFTPPEASSHVGDSFFDPQENAFGRIRERGVGQWMSRDDNYCRLDVRENGAVDFDLRNFTYGAEVGGQRKRFRELLPEMRSRFHQRLLGCLSRNAVATSELETDVEGYPFVLSLRAYAENYAVVNGNSITLRIPDFTERVFKISGERRRSPIAVEGEPETVETYEVVFPAGYTEIETLPKDLAIYNPLDAGDAWLKHEVSRRIVEDRLHVTVRRRVFRERATLLGADYHPVLRDWNRRAAADAARTIVVRRIGFPGASPADMKTIPPVLSASGR